MRPGTRRRSARVLALLATVVLVGACSDAGGGEATGGDAAAATCPDGSAPTEPTGPDPLPAQTLSVLGEDTTVSTACWVGQPLVVNFWAEWCEPCKAEMPDFEAVHQAVGDQVRFIGVDYEDRARDAIAFAEQVGVTYELVEDPKGTFFDAVESRGTPSTLLVDETGSIVYRHAGPLTREALTTLLADHLDVDV